MPYEHIGLPQKRIAVIGGGISGMGAAHLLAERHAVVLYEAEPRLGGHARTITAGKRGDQPADTGFLVFNHANYPYLTALFHKLGVPTVKSNMSFAASIDGGRVEYALNSLNSIFAQRRNLARPAFWRMINDILKFNKHAEATATDPTMTVQQLMDALKLGPWFRDYYLTPFSGAIWSTPVEKILDFPAKAMVDFFRNHALLNYTGQHQWWTVQGGSVEYVSRLGAAMEAQGVDLRLGAPVQSVRRSAVGVEVRAWGGAPEFFDEVVFATHSDDTLRMLADPSVTEAKHLGAVAYQPNDVVLHADTSVMPNRKVCWSSWNYTEEAGKRSDRIDLTYWLNSLQDIPHDDPMFVTLNSTRRISEDLIYDQCTLRHPVYDAAALDAQKVLGGQNGLNRTWFCGAWMKNGFHEDGLSSAIDVIDGIFASDMAVAAQ
ncbi:NAD(P)/FAD-dependent oxidoreductase [Actibacterium sp. 188UL27-1]|uniref:NAD(P)/FAD-dependent oxidoreductase n=1 Tax=Actibacterium sp. 188UL27-1 TaxID=2786961 RepID=UPI001959526E|nr:FAD-dependent oxidoreductase [Actibacterium sp. 188UL27-1]MBM7068566.1 FAD-dependent oxidoreductase [Actibacterium sp. 188UL27-1]